ncbi:MAG: hypothetical protein QM831_44020 [Kofleriaceae bacterium]
MDEDVYFIDTRNATVNDHRAQGGSTGRPSGRPSGTVIVPGSGSTRVYHAQPAYPAYPYAQYPYGQSPYMQGTVASQLFGRVTTGQLIDLVAQIFAALMPLPTAPTTTTDTATDVGNLIVYQGALAQYAKRDEQVRTLGNLVTKLVG